jgi:molybdenum cofactor synthesis domain-containing protein
MTQPSSPSTAAILIIGNEILSGKTQDANIQFIATRCAAKGVKLCEVRVVRDEEEAIVNATRALSKSYTYVFTTGGIGPTHDDITAECIAKAFNVPLVIHPEARQRLADYYTAQGKELNAARLRMAHAPEGATLIGNRISGAPGFKIGNVHVMAGVPSIMQAMFAELEESLQGGPPVLSRTVTAPLRETDIAEELTAIQNAFPAVEIGSYPARDSVSLVLRTPDEKLLATAAAEIVALARKWSGQEPAVS